MAIHYRRPLGAAVGVDELVFNSLVDGGVMPRARYLGFCLGPESAMGAVMVEASERVLLAPGAVVPIAPFDGQPIVRCRQLLSITPVLSPTPALVHVIGLTECYELAIPAPRRAPLDVILPALTVQSGVDYAITVPFGRRHAFIGAYLPEASATLTIWGVNRGHEDGDVPTYIYKLVDAAPTGATGPAGQVGRIAYHIGGTDHEEPWDGLKIQLNHTSGTDETAEVRYIAYGEPGD